ncbi:SUMF1/EgtB/PvdO family nonheme iron enzyme [Treponema sp. C6A8]|uniref:formylglycine-generating enzyme family protein n=1 Tax=Treponema sp. C6A8 TaxID=1410609 RepID=UPI000685BD07|nr:SUMF1/EgtB/PvdO family nonheme iron enzyme [Treponema sp. C6A8]
MKLVGFVKAALMVVGIMGTLISCSGKGQTIRLESGVELGAVSVPDNNFCIAKTEVTQEFYQAVTGENPSQAKGAKLPVESVSWYDSLVFCNKLSALLGKTPCYKVNGCTNPADWGYLPHQGTIIEAEIEFDANADGFRIPTMEEWDIAIKGGENYTYSGSEDLDSVAWTDCNSGGKVHEVAQLKPNGYGIYDMSGNVFEWVWSVRPDTSRYLRGGSFFDAARAGKCTNKELNFASRQMKSAGFRITWNKPAEKV